MTDSNEQVKNLFQNFLGDKRITPKPVELPAKVSAPAPIPAAPVIPVEPQPAPAYFEPSRPIAPRKMAVVEEDTERIIHDEPGEEAEPQEPVAWRE